MKHKVTPKAPIPKPAIKKPMGAPMKGKLGKAAEKMFFGTKKSK